MQPRGVRPEVKLAMASMDDLRKPILPGNGASDYERYLHTDELLALQKGP
jgi:hypothetical protein